MPIFKVHVTQTFRVRADVTMAVEASDQTTANELVDNGEIDKPEDDRWEYSWDLLNEEVFRT